jgi:hypothetical protein
VHYYLLSCSRVLPPFPPPFGRQSLPQPSTPSLFYFSIYHYKVFYKLFPPSSEGMLRFTQPLGISRYILYQSNLQDYPQSVLVLLPSSLRSSRRRPRPLFVYLSCFPSIIFLSFILSSSLLYSSVTGHFVPSSSLVISSVIFQESLYISFCHSLP